MFLFDILHDQTENTEHITDDRARSMWRGWCSCCWHIWADPLKHHAAPWWTSEHPTPCGQFAMLQLYNIAVGVVAASSFVILLFGHHTHSTSAVWQKDSCLSPLKFNINSLSSKWDICICLTCPHDDEHMYGFRICLFGLLWFGG